VLSQDERESHMDQVESLSGEGYRLLGLARKKVVKHKNSLEIADAFEGLEWLGVVAFIDPVREDTREALAKTKLAGIKTIMITGDYSNTAKNVLKKLDIDILEEDIMLGDNLESISNDQLKAFLARNPNPKLFARTKPAQKLKIVVCLREMGEVVAMLGDGVNDAPALANADIGVVVGEASDVAKESADLVLIDSSFSTVVLAVEEGRAIYNNIRKNILYLMSDSFEEILLVVGAIALRLPMPILPAQILWVNLVSDGFPNLALTVDPKDDGVMLDPPRSPKEPLVAPWMLRIITLASVVGGLLSLAMFFYVFNTTKDEVLARSVAFAMVGMDSLIYVFSIKSLKRPTWKSNPFNNKWLLLAVAGGFVVQAAPFVFPRLGALLHVVPIGNYWWMVFAGSLLMFLLVELSKGFLKKN
ncbi:cation-transporting P-type ATPase, partial [Patescibacteria group bacterium]|nr:cation-transporting P-type ATPase [Patescibacteria group bacterium]